MSDEDSSSPVDDGSSRAGGDLLLVGPPLDAGGDSWTVLRKRHDRVELGALRQLREGRPLDGGGELVRLSQRPEHGRLFDVEVLAALPGQAEGSERSGPAQVANEAYRAGWEAIFGLPEDELN